MSIRPLAKVKNSPPGLRPATLTVPPLVRAEARKIRLPPLTEGRVGEGSQHFCKRSIVGEQLTAEYSVALSGAIVLGIAIFLLTLTLVIWQPRKLGIGFTALGGALLTLATGVVSWQQVPIVLGMVWNATLTIVALLVMSLILDEAGFFRWLGLLLARTSVGRSHLLFPLVLLLGTSVTTLLSSDVTVFLWMPVVMDMLVLLGFAQKAILVFALAIGFIASATSLPLPVSSFINLILTEYLDISFLRYVLVMVPIYSV